MFFAPTMFPSAALRFRFVGQKHKGCAGCSNLTTLTYIYTQSNRSLAKTNKKPTTPVLLHIRILRPMEWLVLWQQMEQKRWCVSTGFRVQMRRQREWRGRWKHVRAWHALSTIHPVVAKGPALLWRRRPTATDVCS